MLSDKVGPQQRNPLNWRGLFVCCWFASLEVEKLKQKHAAVDLDAAALDVLSSAPELSLASAP